MVSPLSGMLLVDKPVGRSSFSAVAQIRRISGQKKIGHTGTLDPFATGLLILLLGKKWTTQAPHFLHHDKEYQAYLRLGSATDTYDREGKETASSSILPSLALLEEVISHFQGTIFQIPRSLNFVKTKKDIQNRQITNRSRYQLFGIHYFVRRGEKSEC